MPGITKQSKTLYDKVFGDHIVDEKEDGTILIFIGKDLETDLIAILTLITDRHLVHEVTSPVSMSSWFRLPLSDI